MKQNKNLLAVMIGLLLVIPGLLVEGQSAEVKSPESYFGFHPGSDGNLFGYDDMIGYLRELEKSSDRIRLEEIGTSPMGKNIYIAFFSGSGNIAKLPELKKINRELALEPELPDEQRERYFKESKVFILVTLSMHSTEVGPSQAAPLVAYDLVTTRDAKKLQWLNNVVLMMVPSHNPDGMDMVVEHYNKYKGTEYEGSSLPDVYHKYVGHDNNRDFLILSQEDTKAIAAIYNKTWFPQVMVEKHQMGSTGVRYFVPPNHDPIAENVPGSIFAWSGLFGQNMAKDMGGAGLKGVAQHYLFDDYWPGSTETCIWKNVIGFLTEAASARTASPVYIEPTELSVGGKGLSEYKKGINMLHPWEGGWWRLGDIVEYEIVSTMSVLKTASNHREDILRFRNDLCREMVEAGRTGPPYYYILPREQHDPGELVGIVDLLQEHGIDVYQLEKGFVVEDISYNPGDFVIPLAQPFRAFIKEVMEVQEFPERHFTPGGELIKPYDITSWSLPLHRNVKSFEVNTRVEELEQQISIVGDFSLQSPVPGTASRIVLPASSNASFQAAFAALSKGINVDRLTGKVEINGEQVPGGSFVLSLEGEDGTVARQLVEALRIPVIPVQGDIELPVIPLKMPRIALVETYFHDMDAGWTRYVFDTYHIPFTKIRPHEIGDAKLSKNYDVVIFPDENKDLLMEGKYKRGENYYQGNYHPDVAKGMGKEGMQELIAFLDQGGQVISWGQSTALFEGTLKIGEGEDAEAFMLPFKDISPELQKAGLYVPGSLVKIELKKDHPLTLGMPAETGVFSRGRPVFSTSIPGFDMDRRVIASFPEKEILLSGYAAEEEKMGNKSAMLWLKKGEGQLVLFGFNPQFRASTQGSFKLLFNALLL
ncbi:MAG: M14 family metallopeptidase [Bacteroidales bacterium]|nr:M14 family metallopeptidase [Bacteroidales bacterium]MDT8432240.1 M14 family metallopeptidase [Bacteroidales bacterium]